MDALISESIWIIVGINIILALGLYVTVATGQFSLGHAAFMGIGAYMASVLTVKMGMPLIGAMIVAALFTGVLGALFGLPALRTKGIYLTILTLGLGELVRVFFSSFEYTGSVGGFGGMSGTTLPLVFGVVVVCIVFVYWLMKSLFGQAFLAVGQDELVAETLGINTTAIKVIAFSLGAAISALGGALYAHFMFFIEPTHFSYSHSVLILLFVIFGGIETMWGAVLGAVILTFIPEMVRGLAEWRLVLYGAVMVVLMAVRPQGLISKRTLSRPILSFKKKTDPQIGRNWPI